MKWFLKLSGCILILASLCMAQAAFVATMQRGSTIVAPAAESVPSPVTAESITIPAGTHLLMELTGALHTTSATPGSGIYLETSFPVVLNNRIVIPEHTRVLGVVEGEGRPGRVRGRARLRLRFTDFILPDNRVLSITGSLQSLPGSSQERTVDREGTIEPVDQIDADVYTMAKITGQGAVLGAISRVGIGRGALIGAAVGLSIDLFRRGDAISLPVGTQVEMVLQRPLTMQPKP